MSFECFPVRIGWELTLECNLRCKHCASSAGLPRPLELTTKEALKICDQFPDLLVQQVDFTGGEPLLRADLIDIAMYLRDMGIMTGMVTNGLLLNSSIISQIKESEIRNIAISIDGLEKTHDLIRGRKGSFRQTFKNIKMLQESNLQPLIITTVNDLNIRELPQILQLIQCNGIRCWRLQPMIPSGRVKDSKKLRIEAHWLPELVYFINFWKPKAAQNGIRLICGDGLEYVGENWTKGPWSGCEAGLSLCCIKSDGKVVGCLSMPDELVEGDLRKKDLWDIWFNPDSFAYNRRFSLGQLGANCRTCDKATECRGGCSACSYSATNLFHNNPYCYYRNSNFL